MGDQLLYRVSGKHSPSVCECVANVAQVPLIVVECLQDLNPLVCHSHIEAVVKAHATLLPWPAEAGHATHILTCMVCMGEITYRALCYRLHIAHTWCQHRLWSPYHTQRNMPICVCSLLADKACCAAVSILRGHLRRPWYTCTVGNLRHILPQTSPCLQRQCDIQPRSHIIARYSYRYIEGAAENLNRITVLPETGRQGRIQYDGIPVHAPMVMALGKRSCSRLLTSIRYTTASTSVFMPKYSP